jgi:hypothetical protein
MSEGTGEPVSDEPTVWETAAGALTPDKSLARIDARAQQVIGTIGLVGVALTGLGLVSGSLLGRDPAARALALAAGAAALLAVLLALGASVLRIDPEMETGNLLAVEQWYRRQFRRARVVSVAGWLLLAGLALAAASAGVVIVHGASPSPIVSVAKAGVGEDAKLSVRVEFTNVKPGSVLTTDVTTGTSSLARSVTRAGAAGTATTALEIPKVGGYDSFKVTAALGSHYCTATLSSGAASAGC